MYVTLEGGGWVWYVHAQKQHPDTGSQCGLSVIWYCLCFGIEAVVFIPAPELDRDFFLNVFFSSFSEFYFAWI